jgi:hypothetical protein
MPRRSSPTEKLDRLREKLAASKAHEQEIAAMPGRLRHEFEALSERLAGMDLPVDGTAPPPGSEVGKVYRARQEVAIKLEGPWPERRAEAKAEIQRREAEIARYIGDNLAELLAEIEPDAAEVARAVDAGIVELLGALDGWHEVESRVQSLVRYTPGRVGQDLPRLPADRVRQELRRVRLEPSPKPLPWNLYGEPEDATADEHRRRVEAAVTDAD